MLVGLIDRMHNIMPCEGSILERSNELCLYYVGSICCSSKGMIVGFVDPSNESNTFFFFKKLIFRVKVLTFKFGCSQILNSKC